MRRASSIVLLVGALRLRALFALRDPPSFEGTWTNATITSLQRPERYKSLVIAASEVAAQTASHPQVVRQRTDDELDDSKPLNGSDLKDGRGYNAFWIDPGTTFARVRGEYRTSWIVDPPTDRSRSTKACASDWMQRAATSTARKHDRSASAASSTATAPARRC